MNANSVDIEQLVRERYSTFEPYPLQQKAIDQGYVITEQDYERGSFLFNSIKVTINRPVSSIDKCVEMVTYLQDNLEFSVFIDSFMKANIFKIDVLVNNYEHRHRLGDVDDNLKSFFVTSVLHVNIIEPLILRTPQDFLDLLRQEKHIRCLQNYTDIDGNKTQHKPECNRHTRTADYLYGYLPGSYKPDYDYKVKLDITFNFSTVLEMLRLTMEGIECDVDALEIDQYNVYAVLYLCAYNTSIDYFGDCLHGACDCKNCVSEYWRIDVFPGCCSYECTMYDLEDVLDIYMIIGAYGQIDETLQNFANSEYVIVPEDRSGEYYMKYIELLIPYLGYVTQETRDILNTPDT